MPSSSTTDPQQLERIAAVNQHLRRALDQVRDGTIILEAEPLHGTGPKIIYASEGTPFVPGCAGIVTKAPHPNAAKLFISFLFSREAQQYLSDIAGMRSFHPDVKDKPGRTPLSQIKLLPDDPAGMLPQVAEVKRRYTALFGN